MESYKQKVDLSKRTKRRGTMFPGAVLKQFKDASQLPEVGLEAIAEEEKQKVPKPVTKKPAFAAAKTVKVVIAPLTPQNSSEDLPSTSTTTPPKRDATDEIQRADDLLQKFDTIQARIKKNLENIRKQEQTRFNIEEECRPCTTNVVVQNIMQEIAQNRALHPEFVVDGDVKQLRTEIGQYKTVLRHVGDVNEAVEKTEEVMKNRVCCPGKCGWLLKAAEETKETAVQCKQGR